MASRLAIVPAQVEQKVLPLRGERVMLDADLAALYGVETRALTQAVKRNRERFPGEATSSGLTDAPTPKDRLVTVVGAHDTLATMGGPESRCRLKRVRSLSFRRAPTLN
jgi:hypothetical protein